jgi:MscS family membrane protein
MKRWFSPRAAVALWTAVCGCALLWAVTGRADAAGTNGAAAFAPKAFVNQFREMQAGELLARMITVVEIAAYVAAAYFVSKWLNRFIRGHLARRAQKSASYWDDLFVTLLNGPVQVIVLALFLNFGMDLLEWGGRLRFWCENAITVLVMVSVLLVLLKGVDAIIEVWRRRLPDDGEKEFHHSFLLLVGKLCKALVFIVGGFTLLSHLGVDVRAALASVSVAGLAFGLAAQDTVSNLFGAVVVFVDRPFQIGDRIKVGDVDGNVESIGVRATRVRSVDGFLVTVPNKNIGSNTVVNVSRRGTIKVELNYGLTYETPAARVAEASATLERIFRSHPKTHDVIVTFDKFLDSSLNLNVAYWCSTTVWKEYCRALQEIQLQVKEQFDARGFEFAFPSQTTYHKFDPAQGPAQGGKTPGVV